MPAVTSTSATAGSTSPAMASVRSTGRHDVAGRSPWVPPLDGTTGLAILREAHRVLRVGGRAMILEKGQSRKTWFRSQPPQPQRSTTTTALGAAGFRAARLLADRDGVNFTEGLK